MPNFPPYACSACGASFERFDDLERHRTKVQHGAPPHDAQPTMELRIAALERTVAMLIREMERMQEGSES